jgi:hypothetical protein
VTHILYPTHKKPFDMIAKGIDFENWRPFIDDFRTWLMQKAA